jgi:ribonuclease BN (tRNA processing enzyme)
MKLTVVGCAGSYPGPDSPASCYLLEADGARIVLDMGNGSLGYLQRHIDIFTVDAVLLSHLHADHCIDLTSYYVARKYHPVTFAERIPVYGPSNSKQRLANAYDFRPGEDMCDKFDFLTWQPGATYDIGPFRVTVDTVEHPVEAYAMRVEHGGRTLTYSGDTDESEALVELARGADLFLCEAAFHEGRDDAIKGLHLTGRTAGETAMRAGARRLLLTHLPPWNDPARTMAEAVSAYDGPIELAAPGATYEV